MLNVFDLLIVLCFLPLTEYVISRAFASAAQPVQFPLTAFFPFLYFTLWFVGNLSDPYFLYKFTTFLSQLLNAEESFIYFIYLGFGLVFCQFVAGAWRTRARIGKQV